MPDNITGKTILLLCENFYGYDVAMKETLLKLGAREVVLKNFRDIRGGLREGVTWRRLAWFLVDPREESRRTEQLIRETEGYKFDVLLCIQFMKFGKGFLDHLRRNNPGIKLYLFLWDKIAFSQPHYGDYYPKFDYVYSFDRDDAKAHGFRYYPDFYTGNGEVLPAKYDLAFVGKMIAYATFYRGELIRRLDSFCKEHGLKSFLYLMEQDLLGGAPKPVRLYRKLAHKKYLDEVERLRQFGFLHKEALPLETVNKVYSESKVLLDLSHPNRQGMTINCVTALATGKKLITTNKRIKEEPFYDPAVIYILDKDRPEFDLEFFHSAYQPLKMENLRLDNWLRHLLNEV